MTYGYSLYVDDELIGSTQYAGALDELLKQIKQVYASADTLSVDFVEKCPHRGGLRPDRQRDEPRRDRRDPEFDEVGRGDLHRRQGRHRGQIANNNGMTAAELEALNPGYDINRIHIGDALTLRTPCRI